MTSAPESTASNRNRYIIAALLVVIVALVGIIAQMQRGSSVAAPQPSAPVGAQPSAGESAPVTVETSAGRTAEQIELERFLLEDLPRRQEGDPLAMGRVDAAVVMTEWADYRCPFCSVFAEQTLPQLQRYLDDGTLRIEFRDLALFGDESVKAATAARAAGGQGAYFEFAHELFAALPNEGHPDIPDELVFGIVTDLGLDLERFKADWANPAHAEAVARDSQEAQSLGVSGTPAFVVGSQFVSGAQPLEVFQQLIEQQAAQLG